MNCLFCKSSHTKKSGSFISHSHRHKKVQRYKCKGCGRTFSDQTTALTHRELKPYVTQSLMRLLVSGISQRRCAAILDIHRTTVARKLMRLGGRADMLMRSETPRDEKVTVVFDEMETFEHTKCKPVSIPIAVEQRSRRIIAIDAVSMPAKGLLAAKARAKYGFRRDDRRSGLKTVLGMVKELLPNVSLLKQQCSGPVSER